MADYQIEHYLRSNGRAPYEDWFMSMKDAQAKAIIRTRLNRLRFGNFGDCESVGEGVFELKIDFGPGYRVYFARIGLTLVMLLCGGAKKSQGRDISAAISYLAEYKQRKKEAKNADKKAR